MINKQKRRLSNQIENFVETPLSLPVACDKCDRVCYSYGFDGLMNDIDTLYTDISLGDTLPHMKNFRDLSPLAKHTERLKWRRVPYYRYCELGRLSGLRGNNTGKQEYRYNRQALQPAKTRDPSPKLSALFVSERYVYIFLFSRNPPIDQRDQARAGRRGSGLAASPSPSLTPGLHGFLGESRHDGRVLGRFRNG